MRARGTSAGALVVRTGDVDGFAGLAAGQRTANTVGIVRVKRYVFGEPSIGAIATVGDPLGRRGSWLAGPDITYQTSHFRGDKTFVAGVWGLAMDRDSMVGRRTAFGAKLDSPNDRWDLSATCTSLGDGFVPSLGFAPRSAVQNASLNVNLQPRPSRPVAGLHVRQMFYEIGTTLVANQRDRWESYRMFTAPINWRLESGDRFEFNVVPTGERLDAPFDIADSVTIPPGS